MSIILSKFSHMIVHNVAHLVSQLYRQGPKFQKRNNLGAENTIFPSKNNSNSPLALALVLVFFFYLKKIILFSRGGGYAKTYLPSNLVIDIEAC